MRPTNKEKRRSRKANLEPAFSIIRKFGGDQKVAEICGLEQRTTPYRWAQPKAQRGSGGIVPQRHIPTLLAYARSHGISLRAEDFLPRDGA